MAFVQNTRSRVHTCARAHYLCCNVTAGFFLVFGLAFIIAGSILVDKYNDTFYQHVSKPSRPSYPHWDIDYDYGDLFDHDYEDDRYKGGEMLFVAGVALLCFGVLFVVIGGICVSCACCSREVAHRHEEYPAEPLQQPTQPPYKPQPQYPSQPQYPPQPQYQPQPQFPTQPQNPPAVAAPLPYPQQPPSYEQVVNTQQHAAYPTAPSAPASDEIKKTVYE